MADTCNWTKIMLIAPQRQPLKLMNISNDLVRENDEWFQVETKCTRWKEPVFKDFKQT